jgi:hypothetical protein
MHLSEDCTEDGKTSENVGWDDCVAKDFDIQRALNQYTHTHKRTKGISMGGDTISSLVETVRFVTVRGVYRNFMTPFLKTHRRVNHKSFRTTYNQ